MADTSIKVMAERVQAAEKQAKILAVDDEAFNLDILENQLSKAGYQVTCMENGMRAWAFLSQRTEKVDVILLDKMMPGLDGIELLKKIKADAALKDIPIIMQTAATTKEDIIAGIEAGAYYYITKPFAADMLLSVVRSAVRESSGQEFLKKELSKSQALLHMQVGAVYEVKKPEDGRKLAAHLAHFAGDQSRAVMALSGLIENAIEHGNLEIGYAKKMELISEGILEREIAYRLALPEYADRKVEVSYKRVQNAVVITIKDQGKGFKWKDYIDFEPGRLTDPNGRGIATACIMNPGAIKYNTAGNEVTYTIVMAK